MADAAADANRASNRPTAKKCDKIVTAHPPQTVPRKSTRDALTLHVDAGGAAPKMGRGGGEGSLSDRVIPVEMIDKKFKLAKQTGQGAFSQTFKAINIEDGQLFCIKTIPRATLFSTGKCDQNDAEIFKWAPRRNSLVSSEQRHPNVAALWKAFADDDNLHIMLPECSGGDLFDKIAAGKLPGGLGSKFTAQVVGGLGYIQSKMIAHRDIRPENYMLTTSSPNASLQLIDFALAKLCEEGGKMTTIIGTPTYVAPEVLSGSYDKKCDVWSAGVLCFLMCTGRFPIAEEDVQKQLAKVKAIEVDWGPLAEVMGQIPGLLKDMLEKDTFKRPSGVDLAGREWINQLGQSGGCCTVS